MTDPVMCADGHSYERGAVAAWLARKGTSPCTGADLVSMRSVANATHQRQRQRQCRMPCHVKTQGDAPALSADTAFPLKLMRRTLLLQEHTGLTPNHALRNAIEDFMAKRMTSAMKSDI
jgi:hypothetical protein